jgi:cell division protein FtsX
MRVAPVVFVVVLVGVGGILLLSLSPNTTMPEPVVFGSSSETDPDLIVFFDEDPPDAEQRLIELDVSAMAGVDAVHWCDQLCAWDEFKTMFADQPALLAETDPSVLPVSLRINMSEIGLRDQVQTLLESLPTVRKVIVRERPPSSTSTVIGLIAIGISVGGLLTYLAVRQRKQRETPKPSPSEPQPSPADPVRTNRQ